MEEELRYIEALVGERKAELFSPTADLCSLLLPPSAYHTAWVAMVPDPHHLERPMFSECLDWILANQRLDRVGGFWGSTQGPTIHCLADTIACLVALNTWSVGSLNIEQGLLFLCSNMENILMSTSLDDGSAMVLAGMIELAQGRGLEVLPPDGYTEVVNNLFLQRDRLLETMEQNRANDFHPELFLEVLPANYVTEHAQLLREKFDRSKFRLPSAAAYSFMTFGDNNCIEYLRNVVQRRRDGAVHPLYPIDEDLVKLILVDHLERLGCGLQFEAEISGIIKLAYRNWMEEHHDSGKHDMRLHIYQHSLIFRILRSHGYNVSPGRFCWFVNNKEILLHMEKEYIHYAGAMYELYKASNLMFREEEDLKKAKCFSRKLLQKSLLCGKLSNGSTMIDNFKIEIENDLKHSWLARMDHLEQRRYIECNKGYALVLGNTSFFRLSFPNKVNELAKSNFLLRQSVYRDELDELKRWSKDTGLSNIGFGREKTVYCYFLSAVTTNLPLLSDLRKILTKCGILVTVADDFFDEKGSMDELHILTEAIKRWEGKDLSGHAKVIFDALNEHVTEVTSRRSIRQYLPIEKNLQIMWREIFESWLKEFIWSKNRYVPSIKEYLEVAMISIAIQPMTIPYCYLISEENHDYSNVTHNNDITRLLMLSTRLLNDIQSYQREVEDGKLNVVLLYLKEIQEVNVEESIKYIKNILEMSEEVLLELILRDDYIAMPKEWKRIHLSLLKGFHMLYNERNIYDSPTALLSDIHNAIYNPLEVKDAYFLTQEIETLTSKKEHTYQSKGNDGRYFGPIQAESKKGFRHAACHFSRPVKFEIKHILNHNKLRRLHIQDYRTTSFFSKKPLITPGILSSVRALLFI